MSGLVSSGRNARRLYLAKKAVTANYTATVDDSWLEITAAAAITLPSASGVGEGFQLYVTNRSSANRTINRAGTDTIFSSIETTGASSINIVTGQTTILISDGSSRWYATHTQT